MTQAGAGKRAAPRNDGMSGRLTARGRDLRSRRGGHAVLERAAILVDAFDHRRSGAGIEGVLRPEQFERDRRIAEATGRVDPRRELERDVSCADRTGSTAGDLEQGREARPGEAFGDARESRADEPSVVSVGRRHVGDGAGCGVVV